MTYKDVCCKTKEGGREEGRRKGRKNFLWELLTKEPGLE